MTTKLASTSRRFTLVVAVLLCVWSLSMGQHGRSPARASDREKITAMIRSWEEAWNSHDMHALASLFHDDGIWVLWTGQVWTGRTAIEDGHAAVHRTVFRNSVQRERIEELTFVGLDAAADRFYSQILQHANWRRAVS